MYTARVKFKRGNEIRFISHLDMQRMVQRILRRAHIPMKYSEGFNPHPKLAFAMAMSVGMLSDCEYFDVELENHVDPDEMISRINKSSPEGFTAVNALVTNQKMQSLTSLIEESEYTINAKLLNSEDSKKLEDAVKTILGEESIKYRKRNKKGRYNEKEIRPLIKDLDLVIENSKIKLGMRLSTGSKENLRPDVVIGILDPEKILFDWEFGFLTKRTFLGKSNLRERI
ncbi:TIGR03936 family radical SAM-associated protein [Alkalibacter mobilis]|uniref:TIGR03936 family radical SAM-associated protein n=1 Tax=Alkalibacter mobilis TaxID=2787712 RepID=UPI0018A11614|nr:TIGR03936 family radical SAM-associated protein [Alkalibacter mobilis]MBF7096512.1 DUF2344 domain-containing protein [Alkalibacter mobilis]